MQLTLDQVIKSRDVEDPVNLHVHRSIQLVLLRPALALGLTPNQVTFLSACAGVGAAACFVRGTPLSMLLGAGLLFSSAILDGVDGMVARVTKKSSETGHAIDGAADWLVNVTTFAAAAYHLGEQTRHPWIAALLALAAHLAWMHHLMLYDHHAATFLRHLTGGRHQGGDLERARALAAKLTREHAPLHLRVLTAIYAAQLGNRDRFLRRVIGAPPAEEGPAYVERHRGAMRAWAWLGNAPHMDGMVLAAAADRFDVYFLARIVGFTALALSLSLRARIPSPRTAP